MKLIICRIVENVLLIQINRNLYNLMKKVFIIFILILIRIFLKIKNNWKKANNIQENNFFKRINQRFINIIYNAREI